jgi:hypothetical protein
MTAPVRAPIIPLLTLAEAGGVLGLSGAAIEGLIHNGVFARLRVSAGGWRLRPADVAAYSTRQAASVSMPAPLGVGAPAPGDGSTAATVAPWTAMPRRGAEPRRTPIRPVAFGAALADQPRFRGRRDLAPATFLAFPSQEQAMRYLQARSTP